VSPVVTDDLAIDPPSDHVLVVRPQVRPVSWATRLSAALPILAFAVIWTLRNHGVGLIVVLVLEAVIVAGGVLNARFRRTRMKFTLSDGHLVFTGRVNEREIFRNGKGGKVVELTIAWMGTSPTRLWALVASDGRSEVAVSASTFDSGDLEKLRHELGLEREVIDTRIKATEVRSRYPDIIPWWVAHMIGLYVAGFVLACIIVAILSPG
jgi:hypothetical protein